MKMLLLLMAMILSVPATACVCIPSKFVDKYTKSTFVAHIRIIDNYLNSGSDLFYKSNIQIKKLDKGDFVTSILVVGSSDGKTRTSCDSFFEPGTDLLVYAKKDRNGQYIFDACSGYIDLTKRWPRQEQELKMLNVLEKNQVSVSNTDVFSFDFENKLQTFQGIKLSKQYAIFEVSLTGGLSVSSVKTLSGFNTSVDRKLANMIKNITWKGIRISENKGKLIRKWIVVLYYEPGDINHPSSIGDSQFAIIRRNKSNLLSK